MTDFMTEYDLYCTQHGVPERIDLMLCDINAVLRGKWLPSSEVSKLLDNQVRIPSNVWNLEAIIDQFLLQTMGVVC